MGTKKKGCISEKQLAEVLAEHRRTGKRLGKAAVELGYIQEEDLLKALSAQLGLPYVRLSPKDVELEIVRLIPGRVARRYVLVPLKKKERHVLVVAMADPLDDRAVREVELIAGLKVDVVISTEREIHACIDRVHGQRGPDEERSCDASHKKIGEFLLEGGFINQEQLDAALEHQQSNGSRLGKTLVEMDVISEADWMQALGMQLGLPYVHLANYGLDPEVVRTIPKELARHYRMIPIAKQLNVLVTAMADPQDDLAREVIAGKTGYTIRPVISSGRAIDAALKDIYGQQDLEPRKISMPTKRIGEYLVEGGFITSKQLEIALEKQLHSDEQVPDIDEFSGYYFDRLKAIMDAIPRDKIETIVTILLEAYREDRHIFIMGNGGSASNSSHFACDLSKTYVAGLGHRLRAMSLTENLPLFTAWSNDTHYYFGFAEQLKNLMNSGDVVIGISGSGNSQNVLNGIAHANSVGGKTIGLIGFSGGKLKDIAQEYLIVPSHNMQRVEDLHLVLAHLISSYLRRRIETLKEEASTTDN
ncbi:SIS domain-containing protein [Candidatus Zixiibacteriota bacterium]